MQFQTLNTTTHSQNNPGLLTQSFENNRNVTQQYKIGREEGFWSESHSAYNHESA